MKSTITREHAVLRRIGYTQHTSCEQAHEIASERTLDRLMHAGLIARDPEWTGCLTLTDAGQARLDWLDETQDV